MTSTTANHLHISLLTAKSPTKPTNLSSPKPNPVLFFAPKTAPFNLNLRTRISVAVAAAKSKPAGEQKWTHEGSVTESLPNGMFRVKLDNEDLIIGYISGKIRKNFVRILPGDRVKVEVSRYDSSRGRIVYRMRNNRDSATD